MEVIVLSYTTLVIMAAGMGSRYGGGIKQLEAVGPNGEIIMDYSIYDAIEAGFNKVVFIISLYSVRSKSICVVVTKFTNISPVFLAFLITRCLRYPSLFITL